MLDSFYYSVPHLYRGMLFFLIRRLQLQVFSERATGPWLFFKTIENRKCNGRGVIIRPVFFRTVSPTSAPQICQMLSIQTSLLCRSFLSGKRDRREKAYEEETGSGFSEIIPVLQANQEGEDGAGEPAEKREQENQQHRAAAFVKNRQRRKDDG